MNHPVIELIKKRVLSRSQPRARMDPFKLGLVIEGGGMRGVVGGGMVTGLEYLQARPAFDAAYGSSAGAITAAYFLSQQAALGTSIYYENINNDNFIKTKPGLLFRILGGLIIMDMRFLIYHVMIKEKPLDWKRVINSDIPLNIVTSCITEGKPEVFSSFSSMEDLYEIIRASASMPLIAGPPVNIRGKLYWDASLYESIPLKSALADGCTHVLVLRTRPKGSQRTNSRFLNNQIIAPKLAKFGPSIARDFINNKEEYNQCLKDITSLSNNHKSPPFVFDVSLPEGTPETGRLEHRRSTLVNAAKKGAETIIKIFTGDEIVMNEVITPYDANGINLSGNLCKAEINS